MLIIVIVSLVWSAAALAAPPETPTPLSPADGANLDSLPVTFDWTHPDNVFGYVVEFTDTSDNTTWTQFYGGSPVQVGGFTYGKTYSWRVLASNLDGASPYSAPQTFTMVSPVYLPPVPLSPANNTSITGSTVTITWQPVAGATSYDYEARSWTGVIESGNTTATSADLVSAVKVGTVFWKVKAIGPGGESPWSEEWSFVRLEDANPGSWLTIYAQAGDTYYVWGTTQAFGESDPGPDYFYNLDAQGWDLIGSGSGDQTFSLAQDYVHICVTTSGQIMLDAIGMEDWYVNNTSLITGNVAAPWDAEGAPDGYYATVGNPPPGTSTYSGYYCVFNRTGLRPPVLVSPTGMTNDTTPRFVWQANANADTYRLKVYAADGSSMSYKLTAAEAGCPDGTGNCGYTPGVDLGEGDCGFQVRSIAAEILAGDWSEIQDFVVDLSYMPPVAGTSAWVTILLDGDASGSPDPDPPGGGTARVPLEIIF